MTPLCSKRAHILSGLGLLISVPLLLFALDSSLNDLSQTPVLRVLGVTFLFLSAPGHLSKIMSLQFVMQHQP